MQPDTFTPNRIHLSGAVNVRDVGGYPTMDGRFIRPNTLIRADSLHALTPADRDKLVAYGIRTLIDLRHPKETSAYPNCMAADSRVRYVNQPLYPGWRSLFPAGTQPESVAHLYTRILDSCHADMGQVFTAVTRRDLFPLLVHCQVGKDRTGLFVALLLGLAGVPREIIVADYALSQRCLEPLTTQYAREAEELGRSRVLFDMLMTSPPEAMCATLDHLQQQYGGAAAYLRTIGLSDEDLARLRHQLIA